MSTDVQVYQSNQHFSKEQIDLIKRTIAPGTSDDELKLFLEVCKSKGLNPFTRQIYAIVRKSGDSKKMTIQTGIDGYRSMASSSGKYAGQLGPEWCGEDGEWKNVWLSDKPPSAARVAVLHRDFKEPLWRVAKYHSYVQTYNGKPGDLWARMPEVMLAKCAEALALRAAFPEELSGIYTKEEMMQADSDNNLPAQVLARETADAEIMITEQQQASIRKLCEHLGEVAEFKIEELTYTQAKEAIVHLSARYRQMKENDRVSTPVLLNGDGTPAMPVQDEESDIIKQMLDKCKRRAFDTGVKTKSEWIAFRKQYGHKDSDGELLLADVATMNGELTIREKAAKPSGK